MWLDPQHPLLPTYLSRSAKPHLPLVPWTHTGLFPLEVVEELPFAPGLVHVRWLLLAGPLELQRHRQEAERLREKAGQLDSEAAGLREPPVPPAAADPFLLAESDEAKAQRAAAGVGGSLRAQVERLRAELQRERRTNGGSLWLWCCLAQPGALGP